MHRRAFVFGTGLSTIFLVKNSSIHSHEHTSVWNVLEVLAHQASQDNGLEGIERGVYRSFEASEAGFADIVTGGLLFAIGIGFEVDTLEIAKRAISSLSESLIDIYADGVEGTRDATVNVSVGRLGDERLGSATNFTLNNDKFFEEFTLGTVVVRKERFIQVLIGASTFGPISELAAIADDIDSRWPSDDLWASVPELSDMPVGMVLDEEDEFDIGILTQAEVSSDETEQSTARDIEPGSLSFAVELTVRGLYLDRDSEETSCAGAGFYRALDAGSLFTIVDGETSEHLFSAILSPGTLIASSCAWTIAVLGLPPRSIYRFYVEHRPVGMARIDEIQPGTTLSFDFDK